MHNGTKRTVSADGGSITERIPVYVMAGGHSSRFGSDKLRAPLDGETALGHVLRAVVPWSSGTVVVADRAGRYDDLGAPTLGDLEPHLGPAGGLLTALEHATAPWILAVSGDMPVLRGPWMRALLDARAPGVSAVAFFGERWQPLPVLLHRNARDALRARVGAGERALWRLLDHVGATTVTLPEDWPERSGINTTEDLAFFEARLAQELP